MKKIIFGIPFVVSTFLSGQSNGLFETCSQGNGLNVLSVKGDTICMDPTKKIGFSEVYVFSLNNENTEFCVELFVDQLKEESWPILTVLGKFYVASGKGKSGKFSSVSYTVNREQADEIAGALNVPCNLRKHFGHVLKYEFIPLKNDYKAGDSIYVKFKITNTSNVSVRYNRGGMYRNSNGRCDYFDFDVYYEGILLPDEGPEWNFGGLEARPELKPGQSDSLTECITKWSHFRKPGKYTVQCSYRLHLQNEWNTKDYPKNQEDLHKVWDEKAEKTIEIFIKE